MRPEKEDVFKGDPAVIGKVNLALPSLDGQTSPSDLAECFHQASQSAEPGPGAVYSFLSQLCTIGEVFDHSVRPFAPMWQEEGRRSLLPEDLSARDLKWIAELATRAAHPVLRARLFDLLWVENRDHAACAEAARHYLLRAKLNDLPRKWHRAVSSYQRALQLAATVGRGKPLFREIADALLAAARDEAVDHPSARICQLMKLMLRQRIGDPAEFAARAAGLSDRCKQSGHLELAQTYRNLEADWCHAEGNEAGENAARLAAAELMVEIAEARLQRPAGGAMSASSMLVDAIEAMRRAGGDPARVQQLRARLAELQRKSRSEMGLFRHKFDITAAVKASQESVVGLPFPEALVRFLLTVPLVNPAKFREEVLESSRQSPLTSFIGRTNVDEKGRTVSHEPGLFLKEGAEFEAALELRMFSYAAQATWGIRVSNFITPARLQILNDHQPSFNELFDTLVRNNPFVPPGHEEIFLRGIHAGFHGDFIVAAHLLVPQVENSLRHILEEQGVDVSNLQSDRTQPVKILSGLLAMEPAKKILGASLHWEIRGHLLEKTGFDFRNRVAHGFVGDAECRSSAGVATWWLVLRLCLHFAMTGGAEYKDDDDTG
ncbi:MAG: DUF4209 domain-containing protein [Verrucomicrobiota bacterium]